MVGWLTAKHRTCVKYSSHVNKDSTSLQRLMRQDQARTLAHDTQGTITQPLSLQKNKN